MVAWSIYRRSQQQPEAGGSRDACGLAEAALRYDGQLGGPARAAIRVQQAHALAALGEREALRLLDHAHRWAADDQRGDAGAGHGSFCLSGTEPALRLELLLEIMGWDIAADVLASVYSMVLAAEPSLPHFVLATSARSLITTNQDTLIETASTRLGTATCQLSWVKSA